MKISAEVVAASVSPADYRIVTLKICLPRIILPEFNTHREFSRSFTSNRAMPAAAAMTGFVPLHWGLAQPGMQSKEEESTEVCSCGKLKAVCIWVSAHARAVKAASALSERVSKQGSNRLLEPFQWCVGVVTATSQQPGEWPMANFLGLRAKSSKVEPHMHELAWCVADALHDLDMRRAWELLGPGAWHLPFVGATDGNEDECRLAAMASAMRCARASYNKLDGGTASTEEDAESARTKLMAPGDLHGSPFEHQAMCPDPYDSSGPGGHGRSGNFVGWVQFRKTLPAERSTFTDADYAVGRVRKLRGT